MVLDLVAVGGHAAQHSGSLRAARPTTKNVACTCSCSSTSSSRSVTPRSGAVIERQRHTWPTPCVITGSNAPLRAVRTPSLKGEESGRQDREAERDAQRFRACSASARAVDTECRNPGGPNDWKSSRPSDSGRRRSEVEFRVNRSGTGLLRSRWMLYSRPALVARVVGVREHEGMRTAAVAGVCAIETVYTSLVLPRNGPRVQLPDPVPARASGRRRSHRNRESGR